MSKVGAILVASLMVFGLMAITGCGKASVVGKYKIEDGPEVIELKSDGKVETSSGSDYKLKGTYKVKDSELTIRYTHLNGESMERMDIKLSYKLEGNKIVTDRGDYIKKK